MPNPIRSRRFRTSKQFLGAAAIFFLASFFVARTWFIGAHTGYHGNSHRQIVGIGHQLLAAFALLLFPVNLATLLLPGFAVAARVTTKHQLRKTHFLTLVLITSGMLGYVSFWAFFASKQLGKAVSFAVICCAIGSLVFDISRSSYLRTVVRSVSRPFFYVAVVGVFYLCIFYLFSDPITSGATLSGQRFFTETRPGDQVIPLIFAEKIYSRASLRPFCCGDWLSSDRPPLQAGLSLFEHPLRVFGDAGLNYQLLGTGLQLLWICGVWVMLVSWGASQRQIKQVLGFLVFSGFLLFNTTYPWPKLLAATFVLLALGTYFEVLRENRRFTLWEVSLVSMSISLAMLSHPGSVFSLPAFGVILLRKKLLHFQECVLAATICAVLLLPWLAYQKFYDPPGTRLLKMHLGGQGPIDNRGVWQTIEENYSRQSLGSIAAQKWESIKCLVGPAPFSGYGLIAIRPESRVDRKQTEKIRINEREYIWNAIGLVNAGWIVGILTFLRRKRAVLPGSKILVLAASVNLLAWALILFGGPHATVTTHSSYADILLLLVGLSGFLLALPRPLVLAVFILQVVNFFVVWVWSPPSGSAPLPPSIQMPELFLGTATGAWLIWHFSTAYLERSIDSPSRR